MDGYWLDGTTVTACSTGCKTCADGTSCATCPDKMRIAGDRRDAAKQLLCARIKPDDGYYADATVAAG